MGKQEFEPESVRAADLIRDQIVQGERAPGSRLVERELAAELGVSRLPIRDALRMLVSEGVVTPRPRSWAVVREFSDSDIADLQEVRVSMELLTFRLAAQRRTAEGLADLRRIVDDELAHARQGDAAQARRAGAEFHECVIRMTGNSVVNELGRTLSTRMRWLFAQHDDLAAIGGEHEQLYQALAARDVDAVERLVLQHLETSRANATAMQRAQRADGATQEE